jgi:hypothetical protein
MPTSHKHDTPSLIEALRNGGRLLQQHGQHGDEFFLMPSGPQVETDVAYAVIAMPDVRPGNAGLIEGGPQIWTLKINGEKK